MFKLVKQFKVIGIIIIYRPLNFKQKKIFFTCLLMIFSVRTEAFSNKIRLSIGGICLDFLNL